MSLPVQFHRFRPRLLDALPGYSRPTFLADVGAGVTVAMAVGLLMACGFFIYRMSSLFSVKPMPRQGADGELPLGVAVFELFGSLFFGAVGKIKALPGQLPAGTRCLVLGCTG